MSPSSRMSGRVGLARILLCAGALCLALATARAANVTWTTVPGTASWTNNANWSGGVAPAPVDSTFLTNLASTYTVNFDTASPVVITNLALRGGGANTVTLNINSGLLMTTGALASAFNSNAVINVNSGGSLVLNSAASTWNGGTYNVNGGSLTNFPLISMAPVASRALTFNVISGNMYAGSIRVDAQTAGSVSQFVVTGGYANISDFLMAVSTSGRNPTQNVISVAGGILNIRTATGIEMRNGSVQVSGGVVTNVGPLSMGSNIGGLNGSNFVVQTGGVWDQASAVRLGGQSSTWNFVTLGGGAFTNHSTLSVGHVGFANGGLTITNGTWSQEQAVYVAAFSAANVNMRGDFSISGGSFTATNVLVANGINASGTVTVAGGNFTVTNAARTGVLEIGRLGLGTLNLSNGTLLVDRLLVTNGASSVVNFAGGTLDSRATIVSNGSAFTVGDGVSAATFRMNGGTHAFQNGLSLQSNATLKGIGSIVGNVGGAMGGIASVGNSPGVVTNFGNWDNRGLTLNLEIGNVSNLVLNPGGNYDFLRITGSWTHGGNIVVDLANYTMAPFASNLLMVSWNSAIGATNDTLVTFINKPVDVPALNWFFTDQGFFVVIPEPGTASILILGAALLAAGGRRSRRQEP